MITPAQHAEIRRLYYGEHWTVGTIAAQLGVHPDTVRAAIADTRAVRRGTCRPTKLDPYLPLVRDRLTQYPRLRATRLHEMLRVRGYLGSATQVPRLVRWLRPQIVAPVYWRLTTLIAEECQVDYGSGPMVRHLVTGKYRRTRLFVLTLGYSRKAVRLIVWKSSTRIFKIVWCAQP